MNFTLRKLTTEVRTFHRWVRPTLMELKRRKDKMGEVETNRRSTFLEWNYNAELYAFGKRLGEEFNNVFLKNALLERSYIDQEELRQRKVGIEPELSVSDNSSLSIDGGKLMDSFVQQYLETTLPNLPKRYVIKLRDYLLSEEVLARVSKGIGIDDLVLCAEFPVTKNTLARTLKSVVQALALSQGPERAHRFVRDLVLVELVDQDLTSFCSPEHPMDTLQEALKESGSEPAEPRLIAEVGRNSILASYQVGIYLNKKMIGRGFGEDIKTARDMAAWDALWRRWGILCQKRPLPFKLELQLKLGTESC
ncbi:mitochondrial ribosomal protein L44 [Rhodnius prolixus]